MYKKFPSDIKLDALTFLNDKKIDAELYAYLMSISRGEKKENKEQTIVYKSDLPNQTKIAEILHLKARQTVSAHFKYLIEQKYIIEEKDKYILLNPEKYYFKIPLETLQYLIDTVKETVIKVYIYLGVCNEYKPSGYNFTIKEICTHLGLNYQNNSTRIRNILDILEKLNLITFKILYDEKDMPYFQLCNFKEQVLLKKS